jgi:hypothetical protein
MTLLLGPNISVPHLILKGNRKTQDPGTEFNANFGRIIGQQNPARSVQFALKLSF